MALNIFLAFIVVVITTIGCSFYYKGRVNNTVYIFPVFVVVLASLVFLMISVMPSLDTEILNSQVTAKYPEKVSCEHDYKCRCKVIKTKTSDGKEVEVEHCDTCYEHKYDVSWRLQTGLGRITIKRVDPQGLQEPPRFTQAQIGDPVADTHIYPNYIKANPQSLLNESSNELAINQYKADLPDYPDKIYDYHYVDRVLTNGVNVPDLALWNRGVGEMLTTMGANKQVNVVIVFTKHQSMDYAYALRAKWIGGKKNDVVVVVGISQWPSIEWVNVFSWSENEYFKLAIRDAISELKVVDRQKVLGIIQQEIQKGYVRAPMKSKKYLMQEQDMNPVALFVILLLSSLSVVVTFHRFKD